VVVDALLVAGPAGVAARTVLARQAAVVAPAILPVEATAAVRTCWLQGTVGAAEADAAVAAIRSLRLVAHPFEPFAERVWALRADVTPYDAWYVALAEALGTELVTADRRLVAAPGPTCPVVDVTAYAER
jgi:predicted nucleic acid-binding protein